MLFSHPADYTPVCTTELSRTAALKDEFTSRNVKAIAVSVDPIEDHRGWAGDIVAFGGTELNFPIIADPDRTVSHLYDMLHPGEGDTSTVRSVFIVDPNNKVRLTLTYPKSVGRNFDEIIRVIDALQLTDLAPVSTPVDWTPGSRVIVSPTMSTAEPTIAPVRNSAVDTGADEHSASRRYKWFAVAFGAAVLAFAAISIAVVVLSSGTA